MPLKKSGSNEYLSSSALDYYNRFAKNRGLEKYFRNSKLSKSHRTSSETCLNTENPETENISSEFAKSLTNLKLSDCEINKSQRNLHDSTEFSCEHHAIVAHKSVDATTPVKESSAMTDELSGIAELPTEKSVNLNLLSKIEISLPPQPIPSENPPVPQLPQLYVTQQKILYCVETQTCPEQQESADEPIKPNISHPKKLDDSKNDEWQTSPNESVTSKEHRLEWDSLADVGYSQEFQICDQSALSNTEKKAIKSYMRKQGLSSNDQIVIVKNSPGKQDDATPRQARRRSLNNENWMEVYTKYKDKYATEPKFAPKMFQPDAQSTPMDAPRKKFTEKIIQTSLHELRNKSVQVTPFKSMQDVTVHEPVEALNKSSETEQVLQVVKTAENDEQTSMESGSFTFIGPQNEIKEEILLKTPQKKHKSPKKLPKPPPKSSTDSSRESTEDTSPPVDEELQMAIALMNSVLDSKTMKNAMKKSLIKKLMQKIFKVASLEKSEEILTKIGSCSSSTISESTSYRKIKSFHAEISPKNVEKEEKSAKTDASEEIPVYTSAENVHDTFEKSFLLQNFVKETLKPMTHSEISYENQKSSSSTHISSSTSANFASKESSSSTSTLRDGESMKRKLHQLLTIEKEIDRLAQIKEKVQSEMRKTKNTEKIYENINFKEKGRSRLGTPTSLDNNLVQRKENFMEQYVNQHGKLYDSMDSASKNYTKPYGTTGKSASDNERLRKLSSRASSGDSGTSNRPYVEPKKHTETQTTDSLRRISPYFENKSPDDPQKPQIINKTQINKQIQTNCQQAQAYSIVFDKDFVPKENDERLPGQTLKEYLGEKRPKILQAMDERNECIKELRRLRQLRNEQRQKLLLLTSETCLKEKLRKLPPPPLAQKRLFSTRALKLHSLKQYQNLPEVLKKKEVEKLNNLKRKHRFLLDMFNKNLQQKVLQGKTDLSYNFNLFTNTK